MAGTQNDFVACAQDPVFQRRCLFAFMQEAITVMAGATPSAGQIAFAKKIFTGGMSNEILAYAILGSGTVQTAASIIDAGRSVTDASISSQAHNTFPQFVTAGVA